MINCVSHSISIETKNHTRPSVITASGRVRSFSSGFRIVFSTPKTAADQITVHPEPPKVTPLRIQPASPRTTAFVSQEMNSHLITRTDATRLWQSRSFIRSG